MFSDKSILVTGGTGSFGHTFIPMILEKYNQKRVIIFSRDELKKWEMAKLFENDDIISLNIPTGIPLIYELSDDLNPIKSYYLGNKEEIEKAISSVKNQAKT